MYKTRAIEKTLKKCSKQFACITLYGSRQVGKSTVINHLFPEKFESITMDDIELRGRAKDNPRIFMENYELPIIIDEIQKAPELLEEIKIIIDKNKKEWMNNNKKSRLLFVLTGSNQFELQEKINESLAGRTAILNLSSFSFAELANYNSFSFFSPSIDDLKNKEKKKLNKYRTRKQIFEDIYKGGMPEYITNNIDRNLFFSSYISTYLEKDVKKVIAADNEATFLKFMQYLSLRTGCQIELSSISRDIGIDARTIKKWLSILETSQIIYILEPYMKNISNRLTKTSKMYFMDTGLCSYLGKWPSAEILENGPLAGNFYETYVISEIIKSYINYGINPKINDSYGLYYYRDKDQKEVDLIIEHNNEIYPIEIKKGINPINNNKSFAFLDKFNKKINDVLIIDSTEKLTKINDNLYYCPISLIGI